MSIQRDTIYIYFSSKHVFRRTDVQLASMFTRESIRLCWKREITRKRAEKEITVENMLYIENMFHIFVYI